MTAGFNLYDIVFLVRYTSHAQVMLNIAIRLTQVFIKVSSYDFAIGIVLIQILAQYPA